MSLAREKYGRLQQRPFISVCLVALFVCAGKVVGSVCHGPAGILEATGPHGKSIVHGKRVTGFCNTEEEAVGKTKKVPFLLEDRMKELGGKYEKQGDWADFALRDGRLVTGQPSFYTRQFRHASSHAG